jgi:ABC-type transport system involved in multi-copper enzyme maturation permease subunit
MSFGRIWVIAANVFREVIRDRVLYLAGLFAILMAAGIRLLPEIAAGTDKKILLDLGLAAMTLLGVLIAIFVGTGLINKEIEKRTLLVLISKPVSRTEFIIGKHLGLTAVLAVLVGLMTAIYLGALTLAQVPYTLVNILLAALFLLLQLSLITGVAILFGVFTSSLLATLLTFAVWLMGNFTRDLVNLGILSKNPAIAQLTRALYTILPDLARLDLKNQAVYAQLLPPEVLWANAGYGVLYITLILAIATLIFSRRQF